MVASGPRQAATGHRAECQGRSLLAVAGSLLEARSAGKAPAQRRNDVRRSPTITLGAPGSDWPTQRDRSPLPSLNRGRRIRDVLSGHRLAALLVPLFVTAP